MKGEAVSSFIKLTLSTTAAGVGSNWFFPLLDSFFDIPVFGVPVTTFGAAAIGAGLSLFFGDPIETKRSLFGQVLAAMFFGVAIAALLADGFQLDWAKRNFPMFALVMGGSIRWFLPSFIIKGKELIADFKLSFRRGGGTK